MRCTPLLVLVVWLGLGAPATGQLSEAGSKPQDTDPETPWISKLLRGAFCDNGNIRAVAASERLPVLAVAGRKGRSADGLLKLYDVERGTVIASRLQRPTEFGEFLSLAFAPDGATLVASHLVPGITVWTTEITSNGVDVSTLRRRAAFALPCAAESICVAPDGVLLAAGCEDHVVRVLRLATGDTVAELHGHTGPVSAVSFSPDGELLASAGATDGTVRVWRSADFSGKLSLYRGAGVVTDVCFTDGGRMLVAGYGSGMPGYADSAVGLEYPEEQVRFWSLDTGRLQRSLFIGGDRVNSVSLTSDVRYLAAGFTHRAASTANGARILALNGTDDSLTIELRMVRPVARWLPGKHRLVIVEGFNVAVFSLSGATQAQPLWSDRWHWLDKTIDDDLPDAAGRQPATTTGQ